MEKITLTILLGTNRKDRQSEHVFNFIKKAVEKRQEYNLQVVDVKNIALPHDNYGQSIKSDYPEFVEKITNTDALFIVSPEYNYSIPGVLKSVLDLLFDEYKHKAVAIASVSSGMWGGVRMIEDLIPVLRKFGMYTISKDLQFPNVEKLFDQNGEMESSSMELYEKLTVGVLDELLWAAKTMKWGRENGA